MKSFPQVLVLLCSVLSVAVAADLTEAKTTAKTEAKTGETRRLDDAPWDNGTKVYNEFPNEGWWSGTITAYNAVTGMYTVTWEDGSTDYYDDGDQIDQMVAYAKNDPQNNPAGAESDMNAYPTGTAVSVFEEGEWYDGVVIQYGSGTYTIQWDEDNEIEQIQAGPEMDQMVQDSFGDDDAPPAGYDADATSPPTDYSTFVSASVGAPVSFFSDGQWDEGEITDYKDGTYTVTWDSGETEEYDDYGADLEELNSMVLDANGDDDGAPIPSGAVSGPKFKNGTPVSDWEDGEWVDGVVINFSEGKYVVQWDDEDDVEYYDSSDKDDMKELKKMVRDSNGDDDSPPDSYFEEKDLWKIGTPIAITEDDILWYGKIDGFSQGQYHIAWDNGEEEYEDDFDLVNQMVTNYTLNPKGMSAVGKTFLSLFLISLCAVAAVFGHKFKQKRKAEERREQNLAIEDAGNSYRDQPDQLPKII